MKKYARVVDGIVFETVNIANGIDIADCFHPSLIFIECPADTEQGWLYDGVDFVAPTIEAV